MHPWDIPWGLPGGPPGAPLRGFPASSPGGDLHPRPPLRDPPRGLPRGPPSISDAGAPRLPQGCHCAIVVMPRLSRRGCFKIASAPRCTRGTSGGTLGYLGGTAGYPGSTPGVPKCELNYKTRTNCRQMCKQKYKTHTKSNLKLASGTPKLPKVAFPSHGAPEAIEFISEPTN